MHCIKIFALRGMLGRSCGVKGLHFWPVRVRGLGFMGLKTVQGFRAGSGAPLVPTLQTFDPESHRAP